MDPDRRTSREADPPESRPPVRFAFLDSWIRDRARGSGSAVAISGLARGLASLGHEVRAVRPASPTGGAARRILFNAALPFRLDGRDHDLLVGFDLDGCFLPSSGRPRVAGGTPRVCSLKGIMADEMRFETGVTQMRFALLSRLERRAARTADRVIVTSEYCRRVARDAYGVKDASIAVVPEGIDLPSWRSLPEPGPWSGRPVILSVARQYPRKNTATLLRALPRVREALPDVRLRVVGSGPELPALRHLARQLGLEGAVRFVGSVEDTHSLRREYASATVFCLPSLQEGFGIVFLEAMAAGLPIVAGDAAAVPEVVPDGEVGRLVPPRDEGALADALVRLLRDSGARRELGRRGRRRVRDFAWPRVAERFLDAVEDLVV